MSSRRMRERRFLTRPEPADKNGRTNGLDVDNEDLLSRNPRKRRRREVNLYDAVAGRVTTTLPLEDVSSLQYQQASLHRRATLRASTRDPTLKPDEVLFRRVNAPERFAENDIYMAHEELPDGGRGVLPDSDMLKALHTYSSHFYGALAASIGEGKDGIDGENDEDKKKSEAKEEAYRRRKGAVKKPEWGIDQASMDETALLAFGILLEEAARDVLGKKGDLVFTEGLEADDVDEEPDENKILDNELSEDSHDHEGETLVGFLDEWKSQTRIREPPIASAGLRAVPMEEEPLVERYSFMD